MLPAPLRGPCRRDRRWKEEPYCGSCEPFLLIISKVSIQRLIVFLYVPNVGPVFPLFLVLNNHLFFDFPIFIFCSLYFSLDFMKSLFSPFSFYSISFCPNKIILIFVLISVYFL